MVLDTDSLMHLFSYMSIRHRQKCRLVCRRWRLAADQLITIQKSLRIIAESYGQRSRHQLEFGDLIRWPSTFIKFTSFCGLIKPYHNLKSLSIRNVDQLCDAMITVLTQSCPKLVDVELVGCGGLSDNKWNDFMVVGVTERGWQELAASYGQQLKRLCLQECDINDNLLEFVVDHFEQLSYLDVTKNPGIRNGQSLSRIGQHIEVIKIGPDLSHDESAYELSLNSMAYGNGSRITELHLSNILSSQFRSLAKFSNLSVLVVRFFKRSLDFDTVDYFTPIASLKNLTYLELNQIHSYDSVMAIGSHQLLAIINGCRQLKTLTIKSDYWCESSFTNSTFEAIADNLIHLEHLHLSPGNCLITNSSVKSLAKLRFLQTLSLESFSSVTNSCIIHIITNCGQLSCINLQEFYNITPEVIEKSADYFEKTPSRQLSLTLKETKIKHEEVSWTSLPHNFQVQITDDRPMCMPASRGRLASLFHFIFSLLTFVSTATILSLSITCFLVQQYLSDNYSSMILVFFVSLAACAAIPMAIFVLHIYNCFCDFLFSCHFLFYPQDNLIREANDIEDHSNKWICCIDKLFDWLINLLTS